jgi:hypothetical protein
MATTFKLEHQFPKIPLAIFEAHLNDAKLNRMLEEALGFDERRLLKKEETARGIAWQFLVKKCGDLPKPLKNLLKDNVLAWQELSCFVPEEHCIYWEIIPESKLFKVSGKGVWRLFEEGAGCRREIEGNISVDIPIVGKMVEGFIVAELVKTYEIEPSIQKKFYESVMK